MSVTTRHYGYHCEVDVQPRLPFIQKIIWIKIQFFKSIPYLDSMSNVHEMKQRYFMPGIIEDIKIYLYLDGLLLTLHLFLAIVRICMMFRIIFFGGVQYNLDK